MKSTNKTVRAIYWIILLYSFLLCNYNTYALDTLAIKGVNYGKSLLLVNPIKKSLRRNSKDWTTLKQIFINKKLIALELNASFIEINFNQYNIPRNSAITVEIVCKDRRIPKIVNPEAIKIQHSKNISILDKEDDTVNNQYQKYCLNTRGLCLIIGKVIDEKTKLPIKNARITLNNHAELGDGYALSNADGSYFVIAQYGSYCNFGAREHENLKNYIIDLRKVPVENKSQCVIANFFMSDRYTVSDNFFPYTLGAPVAKLIYNPVEKKIAWDTIYSNYVSKACELLRDATLVENELQAKQWKKEASIDKEKTKKEIEDAKEEAAKASRDFGNQLDILASGLENQKKKTKETEKEKQLAETKTCIYLYTSLAVICICILAIFAYRSQKKLKLNYLDQKKEVERQKQLADGKNENLAKLNEVNTKLFSIISHDLRNPMMSIQGFIHLLKERNGSNQDLQLNHLDSLMKSTLNLLDNLLYWSVNQTQGLKVHFTCLNIFELVEETIDLFREIINVKNLIVINKIDFSENVFADESSVRLILRNLISNAIKFTNNGGTISLSSIVSESEIKVIIEDTGIGIRAAELLTLFTKMQSNTKGTNNEKGVGLGLLLCKEFVEKNEGKIEILSEEGHGTTVNFTLKCVKIRENQLVDINLIVN
jgi:signal transduction histidine kinase